MKRIISLLLVVVLLLYYVPIHEVYAEDEVVGNPDVYDGNLNYDESIDAFLKDWGYPSSKDVHGIPLAFNRELFEDQAIPVYGTYEDVIKLEGSNDFKTPIEGGGYYTYGDTLIGEYRSHGYTIDGNLYQNNDFPRDSDSGRSVSEKEWIYQYWVDNDTEFASGVTLDATYDTTFTETAELRIAIDNMVNDVLMDSTINSSDAIYKDHELQGYAVADHMNVNQINSTVFNGEGKMMQYNSDRLWYQMFSTEKASDKLKKEQSVTVNILDKGTYTIDADGSTTVRVEVTGIYNDSDITSDSDKVVYYHSNEIKAIQLNLTIGSTPYRFDDRANTLVSGSSALTHIFEVEVTEDDLNEGVLTATGESYTVFYTDIGEAVNDSAFDTDMDGVGGGLKSLFDVKDVQLIPDPDNVGQSLPLEKSMLSYNDYSMGDIDEYEITVLNETTGRTETFNYLTDTSSFINDLYDFVIIDSDYIYYKVSQTVSNTGASNMYVDYFSFQEDIKEGIELDLSFPEDVIDIDDVDAEDNTNYSGIGYKSREIKIDGESVNWDTFFGGSYSFGEMTQEHLAMIEVSVISNDDVESISTKAILVHTSLPRTKLVATGTLKENRKVTLTNDSYYLEDAFVTSKYPTSYSITYSIVDGDMNDWKMKVVDADNTDMLFKNEGFYKATITATNTAGRSSSTDYSIGIVPDFEPNVIFNIWNNVLTRDETLEVTYEATSLDGDTVSSNNFKIYFDEDEDGIAEKLVLDTTDSSLTYSPENLGFYKIVNDLEESFGEETIAEFITDDDIRRRTVERVFYVDNLRPLVEIDLDIPESFQKVDLYIMSDENLNDTDITELRESRIDYNNDLRLYGLDVNAEYRDLKTYISSQSVNTSVYYGATSPPSTLPFSSDGFTGTLSLYNTTNNSYEDYYTTTKSYEDCDTVKVFEGYTNCDSSCLNSCNSVNGNSCDKSCCDSKYSYEEECTTKKKTTKHYYTVNQYTGYYSGVATKAVQQAYTNPFQETSDKYVVYVADATGINLSELNNMSVMADFKTILIGTESLRDSVNGEMIFVLDDGSDMDSLMAKAIEAIGAEYPYSSQYLIEVGDSFTLSSITYDTEGDVITNYGYQYVQEEVYDNPTGLESFAQATYNSDSTAFTDYVASSFSKSGLFKIYALLKDSTGQSDYDKNSNVSEVSILAHRKPIADYTLDWTYDSSSNQYQTTFVDKSYDLDHEFSDSNRGIRDVKAMYKLTSSSSWIYAIPDMLTSGTYDFSYTVKDIEGVWSDAKTVSFTLSATPPPQILDAKLRVTDTSFSLSSLPVTEEITFYDVETRYPTSVRLEYGIYNTSGTLIRTLGSQSFNASNDVQMGQDISWSENTFAIPADIVDGNYRARVNVIDNSNSSINAYEEFSITVNTPVDLLGNINGMRTDVEMYLDEDNSIQAETSIYVTSVDVNLIGQDIAMVEISDDGAKKVWEVTVKPAEALGELSWNATYTARTSNGNQEIEVLLFETKIALEITGTVSPNPCLAGELITFTFDTKGAAQRVILSLENIETGNITELTSTLSIETRLNEWVLEYIVPLETDDGTYRVTATAIKDTRNAQVDLDIVVDGNMLDLVKPSDKEGN